VAGGRHLHRLHGQRSSGVKEWKCWNWWRAIRCCGAVVQRCFKGAENRILKAGDEEVGRGVTLELMASLRRRGAPC
jgi:hypothetical protein